MASILDEYEDSLSRSTILQPGCPSVGIPHSGKGGSFKPASISGEGGSRARGSRVQDLSPSPLLDPSWWRVDV